MGCYTLSHFNAFPLVKMMSTTSSSPCSAKTFRSLVAATLKKVTRKLRKRLPVEFSKGLTLVTYRLDNVGNHPNAWYEESSKYFQRVGIHQTCSNKSLKVL